MEVPLSEVHLMPGIQVETHTLTLNDEQEAKVVVWDNGDVDLYIDGSIITVENLACIVAFVELHGQISVADLAESLLHDADDNGGVSPCFVNCGQRACRELGCIRVYNAKRERDEAEDKSTEGFQGDWGT